MDALQPGLEGTSSRHPPRLQQNLLHLSLLLNHHLRLRSRSQWRTKGSLQFSSRARTFISLLHHINLHSLGNSLMVGRDWRRFVDFFTTLDLKNSITIGHLDARHIILRFVQELDFLRIWTRGLWQIAKFSMQVFR